MGRKITLSEFLCFQFKIRQVPTLLYPGTGTQVPPSNGNPVSSHSVRFLSVFFLSIVIFAVIMLYPLYIGDELV